MQLPLAVGLTRAMRAHCCHDADPDYVNQTIAVSVPDSLVSIAAIEETMKASTSLYELQLIVEAIDHDVKEKIQVCRFWQPAAWRLMTAQR